MALGLAVILGLMGVINMAHGEFMMLGAFTAYVVCELFKRYLPPEFFNYYFVCAVPAAFAVTALAGWVCEWALIRHMYGRPLETLLATWGLSLVLIQTIRVLFGDTLALTPPDWFKGSWEVAQDMVFPLNRLFIIIFCACCALLFDLVVQKTKLGLLLRATVQDRDTASSLGVPTRRVDGFTFGLGTGLAGLAGCVIPLYDKINPGMGQGYVVDSFMVVVLGGLGKLAGVIVGGVGLGFLSKFIEPFLQAVYGKAVVLAMIVLFLQWRPAGLFPSHTRLADE
jgi:urea transport system permease protein